MVRLYLPIGLRKEMRYKEYPKRIGLGKYDGDVRVEGELSGCKFSGTLAGNGTTSRWYFDLIHFYVECEKVDDVIERAREIQKTLADKGLKFEVYYYELMLKIPVMLPIHVVVGNGSCQYEIISNNVFIKCEKLEEFYAIKK